MISTLEARNQRSGTRNSNIPKRWASCTNQSRPKSPFWLAFSEQTDVEWDGTSQESGVASVALDVSFEFGKREIIWIKSLRAAGSEMRLEKSRADDFRSRRVVVQQ